MKRFYKHAIAVEADGGWQVALDGRKVKTAAGKAQVVRSRALADELAREWAEQGDEIDPATFLLRDLADYAIDVAAADRIRTVKDLLRYAETDTLCYRADPDEPLFKRQQQLWEPLLEKTEARHAIRLERVSGIVHRPQPEASLERLRDVLQGQDDFALAALATLASLSASLSIALAALEPDANAEALWAVANLEEDWQAEQWGWDSLAQERRAKRLRDFANALRFAELARA
ncbi:ATP12 family protein [Tsuneonella sp. CC-YZS046]|uniref:ATP12 family chaperone protein n=1 Tax=Tsuneonella sp. CC-YZS046 TaxID=3042152 RepID=UPI002D79DE58|nr:ATP12 family protein [Tsuneonella sp. CC-YZS046]WRO66879.1 ATP12 family protein [Tsuneonella sp. CC-YZS046]